MKRPGTIHKTSKVLKNGLMLSWFLIVPGLVGTLATWQEGSDTLALWFGILIAGVLLNMVIRARIWWHHK